MNDLYKNQIFRYNTLQQINSYDRCSKARNLMTRLFLHFWNVAAIHSELGHPEKRTRYLKCVSSHILTLAIELHLVRFGLGASFTFEQHCLLPSTPSLLLLFPFT